MVVHLPSSREVVRPYLSSLYKTFPDTSLVSGRLLDPTCLVCIRLAYSILYQVTRRNKQYNTIQYITGHLPSFREVVRPYLPSFIVRFSCRWGSSWWKQKGIFSTFCPKQVWKYIYAGYLKGIYWLHSDAYRAGGGVRDMSKYLYKKGIGFLEFDSNLRLNKIVLRTRIKNWDIFSTPALHFFVVKKLNLQLFNHTKVSLIFAFGNQIIWKEIFFQCRRLQKKLQK